jgi:branched-chain amino acid transport system substrate-binding protein
VKKPILIAAAMVAAGALALTGCTASGGDTSGGEPIVIGASLPLTGPLQAFGTSLQTGYEAAIDEVNAAGGLDVGGTAREVQLVVQDNASDGDKAGEQARSLVLDSGAIALLGPATPPLTIPDDELARLLEILHDAIHAASIR